MSIMNKLGRGNYSKVMYFYIKSKPQYHLVEKIKTNRDFLLQKIINLQDYNMDFFNIK